jgi:hypothetical protein
MMIACNFEDMYELMNPIARQFFSTNVVKADFNKLQQLMLFYDEKQASSDEILQNPAARPTPQEYQQQLHKSISILSFLSKTYQVLDFYHNYLFMSTANTSQLVGRAPSRVHLEVLLFHCSSQMFVFQSFILA